MYMYMYIHVSYKVYLILSLFLSQTTSYVIRVLTPLFTCRSKCVNIQECPTAGAVVARVTKRPQFDKLAMKRMSTGSLSDNNSLLSDDSMEEGEGEAGEQYLYEASGNIGEIYTVLRTNTSNDVC